MLACIATGYSPVFSEAVSGYPVTIGPVRDFDVLEVAFRKGLDTISTKAQGVRRRFPVLQF